MAKIAALACLGFSGLHVVADADMCVDASKPEGNEPACLNHVNWAMTTGFETNPEWYTKYGITKHSDFADFQCALWSMKGSGNKNGESHGCRRPCSSSLGICAAAAKGKFMGDDGISGAKPASSAPWVWWLVVALVVAAVIAAGLLYSMKSQKKEKSKKKKKRALAVEESEPPAEPSPAPSPAVTTAPYTFVTTAPPMYDQNFVTTAPPVYMQTPADVYAMPQSSSFVYSAQPMAMPLQTYAQPVAAASYYTSVEQ